MQTVSENWKQAHKQTLLNESFVEISLDIADPASVADAAKQGATDNGAIYISNSFGVTDGIDTTPIPYCTLEQNLWCLDGSRRAIPDGTFGDNGFVSEVLSDDTCIFSAKVPMISISFSEVFGAFIPGITITWSTTYGEFADTFSVRAYNGDIVIAEKEVVGNRSVKSLVFLDIVEYDRIEIIINKWCLPNHRARVEDIFVGINKIYGKADLFSYSHKQSADPVSTSLPKSEIKFSIDNVNDDYNPYNSNGLAKYLTERTEVKTRYGLKMDDGSVEWIKGGTYYLSEWDAQQNSLTADFKARDLLEFMSDLYTETHDLSSRSLYDLAFRILNTANLPMNSDGTVKWFIDESLKSKYTTAPLPKDSRANCLQLIANAGECVLYQDRDGVLRIEPLQDVDTDYKINSFNSYSKAEITLSKPLKEIWVREYTYTIVNDKIESSYRKVGYMPNPSGEIIEIDNPLVTDQDRALSIARWLRDYLGQRMRVDTSWRADVRLDALDIVTNENEYTRSRVIITDVEYKFNGAFRATGKGKVM